MIEDSIFLFFIIFSLNLRPLDHIRFPSCSHYFFFFFANRFNSRAKEPIHCKLSGRILWNETTKPDYIISFVLLNWTNSMRIFLRPSLTLSLCFILFEYFVVCAIICNLKFHISHWKFFHT